MKVLPMSLCKTLMLHSCWEGSFLFIVSKGTEPHLILPGPTAPGGPAYWLEAPAWAQQQEAASSGCLIGQIFPSSQPAWICLPFNSDSLWEGSWSLAQPWALAWLVRAQCLLPALSPPVPSSFLFSPNHLVPSILGVSVSFSPLFQIGFLSFL